MKFGLTKDSTINDLISVIRNGAEVKLSLRLWNILNSNRKEIGDYLLIYFYPEKLKECRNCGNKTLIEYSELMVNIGFSFLKERFINYSKK